MQILRDSCHDNLPIASSSAASSFSVLVMLLDDLNNIVAWNPAPLLNDDTPCPWWRSSSPLLDNDMRPPTRLPWTPTDFTHLRVRAAPRSVSLRVAPRPAHYNLLLARHCCSCSSLIAVDESVEQPDDEQETCNAAQDDAHHGAGLRAREVVIGGYYALLYDHLLSLGNRRSVRRILSHGCNVNSRLTRKEAVAAVGARRNTAHLR
jgi:hypothetical protein